jgi:hypothetical protein
MVDLNDPGRFIFGPIEEDGTPVSFLLNPDGTITPFLGSTIRDIVTVLEEWQCNDHPGLASYHCQLGPKIRVYTFPFSEVGEVSWPLSWNEIFSAFQKVTTDVQLEEIRRLISLYWPEVAEQLDVASEKAKEQEVFQALEAALLKGRYKHMAFNTEERTITFSLADGRIIRITGATITLV